MVRPVPPGQPQEMHACSQDRPWDDAAVLVPMPEVECSSKEGGMSKSLNFTIYMKAEPQGSSKAFVIPGTNRASVTSANPKMKPFRSEVTRMAMATMSEAGHDEPMFDKPSAVQVAIQFNFLKPASVPKSRIRPVVKPDIDKLVRAVLDALTGVAFRDDAQVVSVNASKFYDNKESVTVTVYDLEGAA